MFDIWKEGVGVIGKGREKIDVAHGRCLKTLF